MKNIPKKQFAGWMLMLLLCISTSAFAQSPKKVTGRVMDAQGELLIGVSNVTEAADPSNGGDGHQRYVYDYVERK